jgi:predicted MFS family arabinose efflux permease
MTLAFILAVLTYSEHINVYYIMGINFLLGAVNALDAPTRHSFVIEMVGREDLPCAIALNSATFNGARVIGPAVAGIVIARIGSAGAFMLNGISFLAVITGLLLMRVKPTIHSEPTSIMQGLKEAFAFVRQQPLILSLLILTATVSVFSMSYAVLMPVFARDILKVGAKGLGFLMACTGIGALCGALVVSSIGQKCRKGRLLLLGNLTFCAMLILFSFSKTWILSLGLLVIAGWGMMTNTSLTNTLIQTSSPDHLRGRIMSLYTLMFLGMAPIGSLQAGVVAEWVGAPWAVRTGAAVCALVAIALSPIIATAQ